MTRGVGGRQRRPRDIRAPGKSRCWSASSAPICRKERRRSPNRWATHGAPNTVNALRTPIAAERSPSCTTHIETPEPCAKRSPSAGTCSLTDRYGSVVAPDRGDHTKGTPLSRPPRRRCARSKARTDCGDLSREPDTIVAARRGSPLLVAIGNGENFVASDASAVLAHTRSVVYLDDGEISEVKPNDYRIMNLSSVEKGRNHARRVGPRDDRARRLRALMLKEIMEQPEACEHAARSSARGRSTVRFGGLTSATKSC